MEAQGHFQEKKVQRWKERRIEQKAEETWRQGTRWADDAMKVDDGVVNDYDSEESDYNEDNSVEVKAMKV